MMGDVQNLDVIRDWEHLSRTNETSERDDVTSDELDSVGRTFVQNVRDLVEQELYVVATDARKAADIFWEINQEVRESGVAGEQGYFGTRVRVLNKALQRRGTKIALCQDQVIRRKYSRHILRKVWALVIRQRHLRAHVTGSLRRYRSLKTGIHCFDNDQMLCQNPQSPFRI